MQSIPLIASSALVVGLAGAAAPAAQAESTASATASCKPLLKKAKKAARAGQKAKAKRLRTKYRTCNSAVTVRTQLAGYTFTGTRGDGEAVTLTLCSSGAWESRAGRAPVAVATGTNWYVRNTNFSSATKWVTQVGDKQNWREGGWGVGLARSGESFQIGIASFDGVTDLGAATRTPAACG